MSSLSKMTIYDLSKIVGGLSNPTKMPGKAYGLAASKCNVGSVLRNVEGSTCSKCYALKGMYSFPSVAVAHERRMEATINDPMWVEAMTVLIGKSYRKKILKKDRVFRWHDSGDIQSLKHLNDIVSICRNLKSIRFWLPTRETKIVKDWLKINGAFPTNLNVRISATMIGSRVSFKGLTTSTVNVHDKGVHQCPAPKQGGNCGDCRACWNKSVKTVSYAKH